MNSKCVIGDYNKIPVIGLEDNLHAVCFADGYMMHNDQCQIVGGEWLSECECGHRQLLDNDQTDPIEGVANIQCSKCRAFGQWGMLQKRRK